MSLSKKACSSVTFFADGLSVFDRLLVSDGMVRSCRSFSRLKAKPQMLKKCALLVTRSVYSVEYTGVESPSADALSSINCTLTEKSTHRDQMNLLEIAETWGSRPEEREERYPCDDIAIRGSALFRAIDVAAPVPATFRWLCQLKLAPYSYDWLDTTASKV